MGERVSGPRRRGRLRALALAVGLLLLAAGCFAVYRLWCAGSLLPSWTSWERLERACDLDGDGVFETVSLRGRELSVYEGEELACSTPEEWFISSVQIFDIDGDGALELVCLLWKRGSYGPYRPFWVDEGEDAGFSQHVFVLGYEGGAFRQKWCSSAIADEARSLSIDARGLLHLALRDGGERVLAWQGWGFTYLDGEVDTRGAGDAAAASVLVAGDVIMHDGLLARARVRSAEGAGEAAYDFSGMFKGVEGLADRHDLSMVNLEGPLTDDDDAVSGSLPGFAYPASLGRALAAAGFTGVDVANNHIVDAGATGVEETRRILAREAPDVAVLGVADGGSAAGSSKAAGTSGAPLDGNAAPVTYLERGGITFALIAATDFSDAEKAATAASCGVALLGDGEAVERALTQAAERADFTICLLHTGVEYASEPTAAEEALVSRLARAGAGAIVISHPHVVQRCCYVENGSGGRTLVCYSTGNLLAAQPYAETVLGCAVSFSVRRDAAGEVTLAAAEAVPTVSHLDVGGDASGAYLLEDYDEALAEGHHFNDVSDSEVSPASLTTQWRRAMGG